MKTNTLISVLPLEEKKKYINDSEKMDYEYFKFWKENSYFNEKKEILDEYVTQLKIENSRFQKIVSGKSGRQRGILDDPLLQELLRSDYEYDDGFLNLVSPLIDYGRSKIIELVLPCDMDTQTIEACLEPPTTQLLDLITKTLVLEMHIVKAEGNLVGTSSEDRFKYFTRQLNKKDIKRKILRDYPILQKNIILIINQWVQNRVRFINHLSADLPDIKRNIIGPGDEIVNFVHFGEGDTHKNGNCVAIVEFVSGKKIVYKPRPVNVDYHFQLLLQKINLAGLPKQLRTYEVLNKGDHGWTEYIAHIECTSKDELRNFYEKQGMLLALLQSLAATDFHFENLVAMGEDPVLIDLEALFHPIDGSSYTQNDYPSSLNEKILESVMDVGLLPRPVYLDQDDDNETSFFDISGMGNPEGKKSHFIVSAWQNSGTDEMHIERQAGILHGAHNMPSLDITHSVYDYKDQFINGYKNVYNYILKNKREISEFLDIFFNDEIRVILRATALYNKFLIDSYHPDYQTNSSEQMRLWSYFWVSPSQWSNFKDKIAKSEINQLINNDIPIFTTRVGSSELWGGDGTRIASVLEETGLEHARRRIESYCEEHLEDQIWILETTLLTYAPNVSNGAQREMPKPSKWEDAGCIDLLSKVESMATHIIRKCCINDNKIGWLGLTFVGEKSWQVNPLGNDLYNGLPGIFLLFNYLFMITDKPKYKYISDTAAQYLNQYIKKSIENINSTNNYDSADFGGFGSFSGSLYSLTHYYDLFNNKSILNNIENASTAILAYLEQSTEHHYDIISGDAGILLSCVAIYETTGFDTYLDIAEKCANRIIDNAFVDDHKAFWIDKSISDNGLGGFSHGSAGVSAALARLYSITGKEIYLEYAKYALNYQIDLYLEESNNWRDLRDSDESNMNAWCHGAPGIGQAFIEYVKVDKDPKFLEYLDRSIGKTLDTIELYGSELLNNDSLCHGATGNIDFLLNLQEIGYPFYEESIHQYARYLSTSKEVTGLPLGLYSPGLMTGLAGISYGMLRILYPKKIPSILRLDKGIL